METQALFALLEPHVASQGVSLVEVAQNPAGRRVIVRVIIHSEAGVTHSECARVTRAAAAVLDEAEGAPPSYVLEVSSPGTDRVLKDPREFDLFRGLEVRLQVIATEGDAGTRREVTGKVDGRDGDDVVVRGEDGSKSVVPWSSVARARLVPETPRGGAVGGKGR
jgi:ribosome maturation factor RimP